MGTFMNPDRTKNESHIQNGDISNGVNISNEVDEKVL